jgi:hypothetical protein
MMMTSADENPNWEWSVGAKSPATVIASEAKQSSAASAAYTDPASLFELRRGTAGLLRRFAPRNDGRKQLAPVDQTSTRLPAVEDVVE